MAVDNEPIIGQKFEHAIVAQALEFAQKILVLSDPQVQAEHETGLEEIRSGKSLSLEELRQQLDLQ